MGIQILDEEKALSRFQELMKSEHWLATYILLCLVLGRAARPTRQVSNGFGPHLHPSALFFSCFQTPSIQPSTNTTGEIQP